MTPQRLKTEQASEVVKAFEEGKKVQYRVRGSSAWHDAPTDLRFDFDNFQYCIARERHFLPGNIGDYEAFIDSSGLHVGCTTISFERVREIAKACREWQQDAKEAPKGREFWLRTFDNGDVGTGFPITSDYVLREREKQEKQNPFIKVREVLPGEDEI